MVSTDRYFDGREMLMVHNMFRREFMLATGLVERVFDGDDERIEIVISHLEFITNVLHTHHELEDHQVWPLLRQRCHSDLKNAICYARDQHAAIDRAAAELAGSLATWRRDASADSRSRVALALDTLLPVLLQHMDFEEQHVVPAMETYITQEEWNRMIQAAALDLPPTDLPLEFGMLMYEADPEIVEQVVWNMPEQLRLIIRQTAAHSFAKHARRVHGTTIPLRSNEIQEAIR